VCTPQRIFVTGPRQNGKTTALIYFAAQLLSIPNKRIAYIGTGKTTCKRFLSGVWLRLGTHFGIRVHSFVERHVCTAIGSTLEAFSTIPPETFDYDTILVDELAYAFYHTRSYLTDPRLSADVGIYCVGTPGRIGNPSIRNSTKIPTRVYTRHKSEPNFGCHNPSVYKLDDAIDFFSKHNTPW
jgi:hypothetical protein